MSRYGSAFENMPRVDVFNAHDMLFVVDNFDESSFGVIDAVDSAENQAKAELIREVMKNENVEDIEDYRGRAEGLRRWKRRNARDSLFAENSRAGTENVGVYAADGRTADGDGSVGKSSGDSGGVSSAQPNSNEEAVDVGETSAASSSYPKGGNRQNSLKTADLLSPDYGKTADTSSEGEGSGGSVILTNFG